MELRYCDTKKFRDELLQIFNKNDYLLGEVFYGKYLVKINSDGSFIIKRKIGRLFRNPLPVMIKGHIFDDRIEYDYFYSKLGLVIRNLILAIFFISTIVLYIQDVLIEKSFIQSLTIFGILLFPTLIYGIPFVLYDRNDRLVLRKKMEDIFSISQ